jgi:NADH dehydrogenase/NADH oxidase (H2O2-forming)
MAVPLNQAVRDLGISLHLKSKVVEIRGDKAAQEVVLENGDVFNLNNDGENLKGIVVFAAGTKPEISLVKDSPLELGRDGIVVNDKMETNIPDVYAVGDVVQFTSGITGEIMPGKLATNAVPMAKVLGFNLLGKE